jgi:hypothetical protein
MQAHAQKFGCRYRREVKLNVWHRDVKVTDSMQPYQGRDTRFPPFNEFLILKEPRARSGQTVLRLGSVMIHIRNSGHPLEDSLTFRLYVFVNMFECRERKVQLTLKGVVKI